MLKDPGVGGGGRAGALGGPGPVWLSCNALHPCTGNFPLLNLKQCRSYAQKSRVGGQVPHLRCIYCIMTEWGPSVISVRSVIRDPPADFSVNVSLTLNLFNATVSSSKFT
jgi:hypothetical protein